MHMLCLRDMGLMLGEYWNLNELAADCAANGRYSSSSSHRRCRSPARSGRRSTPSRSSDLRAPQHPRRRAGHPLPGSWRRRSVLLLHGGEFGASAEIAWEKTIPALAPALPGAGAGHAGLRRLGEGPRLHRRPAGCGSGISRGSARCSVCPRPTSSATRWVR